LRLTVLIPRLANSGAIMDSGSTTKANPDSDEPVSESGPRHNAERNGPGVEGLMLCQPVSALGLAV
jgi:hypothetical protein